MADAGDDDDKCFGDTLPSLDPCDAEYQEMCVKKISADKLLAPFYASKCTLATVLYLVRIRPWHLTDRH